MVKRLFFVFLLFFSLNVIAQDTIIERETVWDQGIPICPEDEYISSLMEKIDLNKIKNSEDLSIEEKLKCCEIGLAFYSRGQYDAADWYLSRSINISNETLAKSYPLESKSSAIKEIKYLTVPPITIIKTVFKEPEVSANELASMKKDMDFLNSIPKSFDNLSKKDMAKLAKQIDLQIKKLILEKDSLIKIKATKEAIDAKSSTINTLEKEKDIIDLSIKNSDLFSKNKFLDVLRAQYKKYLIWAAISLAILMLIIIVLFQSKKIKSKDLEIIKQLKDIIKKNIYLEHAAKLIRHDMHSGINTYMPRGLSSLEKRITAEDIKNLKIEAPLKMIKEGLGHTQRVYQNIYEFTNLVKRNIVLEKTKVDLKSILEKYITTTSYENQVIIDDLIEQEVNETLFCNAIDILIRNGLKYNDSKEKRVIIYMEENFLVVQDNGRGMTPEAFNKNINKIELDSDAGIGLGICAAILSEHGFDIVCEKLNIGTKLKIKIKND
jgi:signal transduction histidine kinase